MLSHQFVQRVSLESSHEEKDHSGTLPEIAVLLLLEYSHGKGDSHRLSGSGPFKANDFSNRVSKSE